MATNSIVAVEKCPVNLPDHEGVRHRLEVCVFGDDLRAVPPGRGVNDRIGHRGPERERGVRGLQGQAVVHRRATLVVRQRWLAALLFPRVIRRVHIGDAGRTHQVNLNHGFFFGPGVMAHVASQR